MRHVFEKSVKELNPDAIVITGDITNEDLIKEYEKAN